MTESIKSMMDKAFGLKNDNSLNDNSLVLSLEQEMKNVNIIREIELLRDSYIKKEISGLEAKTVIGTMIMTCSREQIERVFLKWIWDRQMTSEQIEKSTKHKNKIGFNRIDARFASSLVEQIKTRHLTVRQIEVAKKMLVKYWKQYLDR